MKAIHIIQALFETFQQKKYFYEKRVHCTKTNMLLNFRNLRNISIRKFNLKNGILKIRIIT